MTKTLNFLFDIPLDLHFCSNMIRGCSQMLYIEVLASYSETPRHKLKAIVRQDIILYTVLISPTIEKHALRSFLT